MNRISADEAFRALAKWSQARTPIQVAMSRSVRQGAAGTAIVNSVLTHSQKVLLTLRDENGADVKVTVSLEGAEWEHPPQGSHVGVALPDVADVKWVSCLVATFPNGNRYVFGERARVVPE